MTLDLTGRGFDVAPRLLGARLTSTLGGERVTVRLTEVEAYEGAHDPASHAYRGKTPRNQVMFGPAGAVYVYRHMGLHYCMNITCAIPGTAAAVLLRSGEVLAGHDTAWRRRNASGVCRSPRDLARGPARLTVALAVNGEHNGMNLSIAPAGLSAGQGVGLSAGQGGGLTLEPPSEQAPFRTGPRIGVRGPGADPKEFPWRFWIDGDEYVSG